MDDQLYVRIRGRVQGPFDMAKLRALVRRGQLSRMHEVSLDGNDWKQASAYQALFLSETKQPSPDADQVSEDDQPIALEAAWHYSINGVKAGPVTFQQLQALASPGHLAADDLVWKEGMQDWAPSADIPGLLIGKKRKKEETITEIATTTAKLSGGLVRILKDSQAWVGFIAICLFLFAFLSFMAGMYLIISGIITSIVIAMAWGTYGLLYAAVFFYGGWLLHAYRKQLQRVVKEKSLTRLEVPFQTLRTFWLFISIILIIFLVNGIAFTIWAVSIGIIALPAT